MSQRGIFFFLLSLLVVCSILPGCRKPPDVAKVLQVIDGDTIIIEGGHYVRYIGIDSPEKHEPLYSEAKRINEYLVEGKTVKLQKDISDRDKYGRMLRYVYVDDIFVNAEIVRQGYAYAEAYSPDIKYQVFLYAVASEAKQLKRGVWQIR